MNISRPAMRSFMVTLVLFAAAGALAFPLAKVYKSAVVGTPENLTACFEPSTEPGFASTCLHKTIAALLSEYPTRTIQAYTVATSSPAVVMNNCHAIGHVIGEETYKKAGSLEQALSLCTSACQSACTHGALGAGVLAQLGEEYPDEDIAHADDTAIEGIGAQYCADSIPLCHGVGHILYLLNSDTPKGFAICKKISTGYFREACYQGIFMERTGKGESLSPFQATTTYAIQKDDYTFPCLSVPDAYRHACFQFLPQYQQALFAENGIVTSSGKLKKSIRTCGGLSEKDRSYCFEGIGINANLFVSPKSEDIWHVCDQMPEPADRDSCTIGIIPKDFFLGGFGLSYCASIHDSKRQALCYNAAFTWMEKNNKSDAVILQACAESGEGVGCSEQFKLFSKTQSALPDYRFGLFGEL